MNSELSKKQEELRNQEKSRSDDSVNIDGSQVGAAGKDVRVDGGIHYHTENMADKADIKSEGDVGFAKDKGIVQIIKNSIVYAGEHKSAFLAVVILMAFFAFLAFLLKGNGKEPSPIIKKEKPLLAVENPILRHDAVMIIIAKNKIADQCKPLDVEFDGILFSEKGVPLKEKENVLQKWHFAIRDQNFTDEMIKEGYHQVRMGFPGDEPSKIYIIAFKNKPPVLRVETVESESEPDERIVRGKAASELQIPGETISVEVMYFHDGGAQKIDIPVRTETDEKTGITYFEFETAVQGLPKIPADDPRYSEPFFGFKITDQAGNNYYQEQSYAQYMAPGANRFGFSDLAIINVEKLPEADDFRNIIRVVPQIPLQHLTDGESAIRIEVTGSLKTQRHVKISSNVKNRQPLTIVLRDEKQIGTTLTDEFIDIEKLDKKKAEYRVEQEDIHGARYTSNTVPVSESENAILTVRSNVYEDTVFIGGVKHGSTRLDIELKKGKHMLRVEKEGYEPFEKEIDLQNDNTIWAKLKPISETVQIVTEPSGAVLFSDNKKIGVSPFELKLSVTEKIRLRAEMEGYSSQEKIIEFPTESPVKIVLEPLPISEQTGRLYITTKPSDAIIEIQDVKEKYRDGMELDAGSYGITVSKKGYKTSEIRADITGGKDTIEVELEPENIEITTGKTITNSIGMKFVYIKRGTFMMGSPENEPGRGSDEKQHKVTLTKGFYMQTTEVTQKQWKAVMGNNPSSFKNCDDCPVKQVSWNGVQEFIKKLNQKEGTELYRLPTEAEWEYACRAGTATPFSFGKCLSTDGANYDGNYPLSGCPKGEYLKKTAPVASFQPNAWGLYDMHGNVWEWCSDWYGDYPTSAVVNPTGADNGSVRVFRGGSWLNFAGSCRSAYRRGGSPGIRDSGLGFRLLRDAP